MSTPIFKQLNDGWNAEPNAPQAEGGVRDLLVRLRFVLNPFAYAAAAEEQGCLTFTHCSSWRLGPTNDEGWYWGQCRYSKVAPKWGEFYELTGDDDLQPMPTDWHRLATPDASARHFLFYLRDGTFECLAADWVLERLAA